MHAVKLLHKMLSNALPQVPSTRLKSLLAGVESLLRGRELWLTGLGRHLSGKVLEKHKIKRMDRLLGNPRLHLERSAVYGCLSRLLIGGRRHPCIIVDWSDVDARKTLFILRAAVSVGGRALGEIELPRSAPMSTRAYVYQNARGGKSSIHRTGSTPAQQCQRETRGTRAGTVVVGQQSTRTPK